MGRIDVLNPRFPFLLINEDSMYKFIKIKDPENEFDNADIEFTVDCETRVEMCDYFADFLKACGFSVKGTIEFVEEE